MIPPLPRYPALHDIGDWQIVESVPDTETVGINAKHWHALKRLFTWMTARQIEAEERIAKLEAAVAEPVALADLLAKTAASAEPSFTVAELIALVAPPIFTVPDADKQP